MSKKTALITGAGSGIGRATAQKLANHGINLILIGRNLNKLEETKKLCDKVDIKCFSVDISHKEEIKTLFDHNLQFDYLINNAGVTMNKRFEEVTEEDANALGAALEEKYPEVEVEIHFGGQPIYYYVISVE
mgnify:CR=1 FL=1